MVICYHIFEAFATIPYYQGFNHGYLAVDFFFILSGFVVGYAYDDRWGKMRVKDFFRRRLIRLQPMVVMGALLGTATFLIAGREMWSGAISPLSMVMLAMLMHMFLIPALPGAGAEVRGNGEMFPLNGPSWSLFFEYIGNILYALFLRKLSTRALKGLVVMAGVGLATYAIGSFSGYGHMGVGWSLGGTNFPGGMLRLLFAFPSGLLLSRVFKPVRIKGAFWICSAAIVVLLSMPYVGDSSRHWMNGLYDTICIVAIFPLLVWLGASGVTSHKSSTAICRFLGDLSYPLYMVHYPFMYLFYAWIWKNGLSFAQTWAIALLLLFGNMALAWGILKVYDEPLRKWLSRKGKG